MKSLYSLILVCLGLEILAQEARLPLETFTHLRAERSMVDSAFNLHPEIRPYSTWTVKENQGIFHDPNAVRWRTKLGEPAEDAISVLLTPRVNAMGYFESGSNSGIGLESWIGAGINANFKNKLRLDADLIGGYNEPVSYLDRITDSLHAVPGYSYANRQGGFGYHQSTITLAWKPSKVVELMAGRGKHFIGEGYRSMFISDYAPNFNYVRTDVNVWRLKYMVLYAQMRASTGYPDRFYGLKNKYSTMHYLSLNVTKWWSVGAFEAVVWESEDSVQIREVDINYLNPIIFFRPIEYSLGSSDNSLLGFSSTIRPARGFTMYGQLMIDEFIMREALAPVFARLNPDSAINTAWYGNKQAFQLGLKYHEPFGWKRATVLAEVNVVRPYTYSHGNSNQSYTHMTQPLAHPLGSNFIEWVALAAWQPNGFWNISIRSTYARKGHTTPTRNMGEEPMIESSFLVNAPSKYGYYMLQGRIVDVANVRVDASYTIIERWNMRIQSSIQYRLERSNAATANSFIFGFGISTALWNDYKNL